MRPSVRIAVGVALYVGALSTVHTQSPIGREVAVPRHLQDREEFSVSLADLLEHGHRLFTAVWTIEEGGGRPLTKGTGANLTDAGSPLVLPRSFNRISGPDSTSCSG